uniref:Serine/threonine-protein phosphatase n=1 Tax=Paramormyrops kingsleyae TaxID=1676925 RepID=A0A3B3QU70_9TELE
FNISIDNKYKIMLLSFPAVDHYPKYTLISLIKNFQWKTIIIKTYINNKRHNKRIYLHDSMGRMASSRLYISYVLMFLCSQNGMPSMEKPYVFNGDFVDRGKDSVEILLILFAFLLVYPSDVHLNRGNHEDHIVNLRYGFTKEVLGKYRVHGRRILKLLQMIFRWLPLATVIDHKVLILHGGISDTTDLSLIAKMDRHRVSGSEEPHSVSRQNAVLVMGCRNKMAQILEVLVSKCSQRQASMADANPLGSRNDLHRRSLEDFSSCVARPVEDELEECRRKARCSVSIHDLFHPTSEDSSLGACHPSDVSDEEWKQSIHFRKHHLQLLIRSHECKQEGYEFCHNRKVLTLFSASNYYEVGSNRGAYVTLGSDLAPHLVQYQASNTTRELTLKQRVGWTEHSALKVLREQLFSHRPDLIRAFQETEALFNKTGWISVNDWACAVEAVLQLGVPWRVLRSQLVPNTSDGKIDYQAWFRELAVKEPDTEHIHQTLLDMVYRHRSTLETIFRIVDTDHSGLISLEDFHQIWKLLSAYLNMEISDEAISKLAITIDDNGDGSIDINEFMEAFRLVDKSRLENDMSQEIRHRGKNSPSPSHSSGTGKQCNVFQGQGGN